MSDTRLKLLTATTLLTFLGLVTSIAGLHPGDAELSEPSDALKFQQRPPELNKEAASWRQSPATTGKPLAKPPSDLQACSTAPDRKRAVLSRQASTSSQKNSSSNATAPRYWPRQAKALAYSTNYGDRLIKDVYGRPVNNQLLVVLHETVGSAAATIRFFQTPHYQDSEQASYHAMVTLDGTIVYLLPPEKRAFGAGNSVFVGLDGPETVKTKLDLLPSVNNFAYHISLETPPDGNHNRSHHSGYTEAQYKSLAWLVARTRVADSRITTHKAVDRSGERQDPRSFNFQKFLGILQVYPRPEVGPKVC